MRCPSFFKKGGGMRKIYYYLNISTGI